MPAEAMPAEAVTAEVVPADAGPAGAVLLRLCLLMLGAGADPPGFELPLRLLLGFRVLIDELHAELARQGHPGLRPMHGFVFQAIGPGGTTAAGLAAGWASPAGRGQDHRRAGAARLRRARADPADARRKVVRLTGRAVDALERSARIFDDLRAAGPRSSGRSGCARSRPTCARSRRRTPSGPMSQAGSRGRWPAVSESFYRRPGLRVCGQP